MTVLSCLCMCVSCECGMYKAVRGLEACHGGESACVCLCSVYLQPIISENASPPTSAAFTTAQPHSVFRSHCQRSARHTSPTFPNNSTSVESLFVGTLAIPSPPAPPPFSSAPSPFAATKVTLLQRHVAQGRHPNRLHFRRALTNPNQPIHTTEQASHQPESRCKTQSQSPPKDSSTIQIPNTTVARMRPRSPHHPPSPAGRSAVLAVV